MVILKSEDLNQKMVQVPFFIAPVWPYLRADILGKPANHETKSTRHKLSSKRIIFQLSKVLK